MEPTIIDRLVQDNGELAELLREQGQISHLNDVENSFRKTLLLAAASYFESEIKDTVIDFARAQAGNSGPLVQLIRNKAIERQYHTFFTWDSSNANTFFSMFGSEFKEFMKAKLKEREELATSIRNFLELGNLRNQLVHQNFATFEIEKTPEEIFALYRSARAFVESIGSLLTEHAAAEPADV